MLAHSGHVTLEAVRWCADHGITVVQLARDGATLAYAGAVTPSTDDARIRPPQAIAGTSTAHPAALEIARMLLTHKEAYSGK